MPSVRSSIHAERGNTPKNNSIQTLAFAVAETDRNIIPTAHVQNTCRESWDRPSVRDIHRLTFWCLPYKSRVVANETHKPTYPCFTSQPWGLPVEIKTVLRLSFVSPCRKTGNSSRMNGTRVCFNCCIFLQLKQCVQLWLFRAAIVYLLNSPTNGPGINQYTVPGRDPILRCTVLIMASQKIQEIFFFFFF